MTIVKYLVDTNALSRMGRKNPGAPSFGQLQDPKRGLHEAATFPDIAMLTLSTP